MKNQTCLGLFLLSLLLPSCLPLQSVTSGQIGCPADKIVIADEAGEGTGARTWTAQCNGRTYYCSATPQIACREATDSPSVPR